jgi:hypothetical protein
VARVSQVGPIQPLLAGGTREAGSDEIIAAKRGWGMFGGGDDVLKGIGGLDFQFSDEFEDRSIEAGFEVGLAGAVVEKEAGVVGDAVEGPDQAQIRTCPELWKRTVRVIVTGACRVVWAIQCFQKTSSETSRRENRQGVS